MFTSAVWSGLAALCCFLLGIASAGATSGGGFSRFAQGPLWIYLLAPAAAGLVFIGKTIEARQISGKARVGSARVRYESVAIATEGIIIGSLIPVAGALLTAAVAGSVEQGIFPGLVLSCLPAALVFAAANRPASTERIEASVEARRDRRAARLLIPLTIAGVVAAGLLYSAPSEVRLLALGPSVLVSLLGIVGLFHPNPGTGRSLAALTARICFVAILVPLTLVMAFA